MGLTSSTGAQAANFPFCTIEPNLGVITVPDERLNKLAEIVHPGRIVPATCEIVDIAGLVKGASKGEGLGNKFLGNIRECDAIIHVIRCFDDDNIVREGGAKVDPLEDKSVIDTELQLKDLETIESQLAKQQKTAAAGNKDAKLMVTVLEAYKAVLEQGKNARGVTFETKEEQKVAHDLFLLPLLHLSLQLLSLLLSFSSFSSFSLGLFLISENPSLRDEESISHTLEADSLIFKRRVSTTSSAAGAGFSSSFPDLTILLKLMQSYNIFSLCANNSAIIFG